MKELTKKEEIRKEEILSSLINWQMKPAKALVPFHKFFSDYAGFTFECDVKEQTNFTVYFGLDDSKGDLEIVAHVIPEYQDQTEEAYAYVVTRPAEKKLDPMLVISKKEARKRIHTWKKYGDSWVAQYQENLFKAVSIPGVDFKTGKNSFTVFFGLKEVSQKGTGKAGIPDEKSVFGLDFDLILHRTDHIYLDTVHLVPPFKPQKAYILSQIPAEITL